ncbi:MAG: 30S ribosome-binding factor RbfA [Candidatus Margulisiibacteriota bacterium]
MSTPSPRAIRIAALVKAEIARTIQTKLNKKLEFISIVEVIMSNDLSLAKVYISVLGDKKQETIQALQQSTGFIKKEMAQNLKLRIVPEISFFLDDRLERGDRVLKIIKGLNLDHSEDV